MDMNVIAVSACLMGINCRYNGSSAYNNELHELVKDQKIMLFCPEILGNLSTPRKPAEIVNGDGKNVVLGQADVMDECGKNVTREFVNGAAETMNLFKENDVSAVVLKDRSPSCGVDEIYDGNFSGTVVKGCGILTAMLLHKDIEIFSDKNSEDLKKWIEVERMKINE